MNTQDAYLAHHGVLGMKWGIRKERTADGGLTKAGKSKYTSMQTKAYAKKQDAYSKAKYRTNKEVDDLVTSYADKTSTGKAFVGTLLLGTANYKTYVTSRAVGDGRMKAFLKACYDINVGTVAGTTAQIAINNVTKGKGSLAGYAVNQSIQSALSDVSLQQNLSRNKYAKQKVKKQD